MNSKTVLKLLALLFSAGTIAAVVHTVAVKRNAGVSVVLMVWALIFTTAYKNKK